MTTVLVTGMSGTGNSSVLVELAARGYDVVDTDSDEWCEWVQVDGESDWIWRQDRMDDLLARPWRVLFVSGCKSNQGRFYDRFDAVVLLSAPVDVLRRRILGRSNNDYGKSESEWQAVVRNLQFVEPLLPRDGHRRTRCDPPAG